MYQVDLAKNWEIRYTYDELSRVTERIETNVLTGATLSTETFTYDAAGNVTEDGENTTFVYDTNNRLTQWENNTLCYDANGNLLNGYLDGVGATFGYDSANRLLTVRNHTYTYNAEDVRIKAVRGTQTTVYTYDTSEELSRLLMKSVGNTVTKYVYGDGLIGEETDDTFTTYHFDYRGSTVALTDEEGAITDTFEYDTYGKLTGHTGSFDTLFLYNGQYGVMTENIGLCYMRARYYSPEMRRFINADVVAGEISDAITLNRYAYANGNPVSNIDPFGLEAERGKKKKKQKKGWNNWLKVGIGVMLIVCLGIAASVVTGGVVGVMLAGAFTGALVSSTVGAVSGYIQNGWDGAATGFMTGAISGAASGALGASTGGFGWQIGGNAIIDAGVGMLEDAANGEKVEVVDVVKNAATGALSGYFGGRGMLYKKGKPQDHGILADPLDHYVSFKKDRLARANKDTAKKDLRKAALAFYETKDYEIAKSGFVTFVSNIADAFGDAAYEAGKDRIEQICFS